MFSQRERKEENSMKKFLSILLTLTMLLSLSAAAFAEGEAAQTQSTEAEFAAMLNELFGSDEVKEEDVAELFTALGSLFEEDAAEKSAGAHEITSASYPLYLESDPTGTELTLYFLDGVTDLPYIEINDWMALFGSFYETADAAISFELNAEGPIVTATRHNTNPEADDNLSPVTFDFDENYIEFMDYNLFTLRATSATMSTFNEAGEPTLLQKVDTGSFYRYGDALKFDLAAYNIDLIQQDDLYLIPMATLSDIFMPNTMYGNLYFNGKYVFLSGNTEGCADVYYDVPTGERSEALTEYGYNELCMMLDYFYGLKDVHGIESFGQLFHNVGFDQLLKGPEVKQADGAIYRMITDFLDDGHTAWHAFSYLTGPVEYKAVGLSRGRLGDHMDRQMAARAKYYPDGVPGYEEIGNTAYITFDHFISDLTLEPEDYYHLDEHKDIAENDVFALLIKAHEQITRENSPIENVVIDLSCNGGGADNVAAYVTAWFLGECCISNVDQMTGAMSTGVYKADVNLDRVFDEKDNLGGRRLFCLESPFSFSNGNYVPCAFKESGKVTLLGRTSGGGSCNVLVANSPWGTSFQISANTRVSFLKNGSFYDVDRGAEPDVVISTPEKYYDRAALTDFINSIY